MGGNTSKEKKKNLKNMLNESITSQMNKNSSMIKVQAVTNQSINASLFDFTGCQGTTTLGNIAVSELKIAQTVDSQAFADFMNSVANDFTDKSKKTIEDSEKLSEMYRSGDNTSSEDDTETNVKNIIKNSISNEEYNNIVAQVNMNQVIEGDPSKCMEASAKMIEKLKLSDKAKEKLIATSIKTCAAPVKLGGSECKVTNELMLNLAIKQVVSKMISNASKNESLNKYLNESEEKRTTSNALGGAFKDLGKGFNEVGKGINNALGGGYMGGIVSVLICAVLAYAAVSMKRQT